MHVLILPSWYTTSDNPISGCFFREQAIALSKSGIDVGIIAPTAISIRKCFKKQNLSLQKIHFDLDEGVPTFRHLYWNIPKVRKLQTSQFLWSGFSLFQEYKKRFGIPDILHAHSTLYGGVLAQRIKYKTGIPYVVTEHSSAFSRNILPEKMLALARSVFLNADKKIFVSPALAKTCEDRLKTKLAPWEWVPNMVSDLFSTNSISRSSNEKFVFLNVGFLTPNKGQLDLIKAFSKFLTNNPGNFELRIGGDGPSLQGLMDVTEEEDISEQVKFLGRLTREQVKSEMSNCNVFVLSSHHETFGVVVIEALASGKPVIATKCGGPEYIVNEKNGILIEPGRFKQLAQAMEQMRASIEMYNPEEIVNDCINRFSEKTMVKKLVEIYREVLETSNSEVNWKGY